MVKTVIRCLLLASPARHRPLSALRPIPTCQLDSAALQLRLAVWRPPYGKTVIRCLLLASPARHRPPRLSVRSPHASSTPLLCSSVSLYGVRHMAKPSSAVFCWLRLQDIGRPGSPSDPHMPAQLRCFAAPSRCMASAIWQKPSSAVFCWLRLQDIGRPGSPSDPHMPARLRCFGSSVSLYGVRHMAKPSSAVFCWLRLQDIGRRFCRMCGSGITTCKDNLRFPSLLPACSNHGILFCVL